MLAHRRAPNARGRDIGRGRFGWGPKIAPHASHYSFACRDDLEEHPSDDEESGNTAAAANFQTKPQAGSNVHQGSPSDSFRDRTDTMNLDDGHASLDVNFSSASQFPGALVTLNQRGSSEPGIGALNSAMHVAKNGVSSLGDAQVNEVSSDEDHHQTSSSTESSSFVQSAEDMEQGTFASVGEEHGALLDTMDGTESESSADLEAEDDSTVAEVLEALTQTILPHAAEAVVPQEPRQIVVERTSSQQPA